MHTELFLNPGSCSAVTGHFFVMSAFLSLYRGIFYVGLLGHVRCNEDFVLLMFVISRFLHTIYCNFGRVKEYRSLYRGLVYKDVR